MTFNSTYHGDKPPEAGDCLPAYLDNCLQSMPRVSLCVAFSGGPDSTALLHALAQLPGARHCGLRALHINHGLHADSANWAIHCQHVCAGLNMHCTVSRAQVNQQSSEGLEAAARRARYQAFEQALAKDEWLLLAHHRDDQIETVLLKLLRGGGPESLGGMRAQRALGKGQLWRPLLAISGASLRRYLLALQLDYIIDPSNADTRLSRNYLRQQILPRLNSHWPQATDSILHSAMHCRNAADALRMQWLPAFESLYNAEDGSLSLSGWLALVSALREPLLDHWLYSHHLPAPTSAQRQQIQKQCQARSDRLPCIRWHGTEIHIWKNRLWAHSPLPPIARNWQCSWQGETLQLPDGGYLSLNRSGVRLEAPLSVRLRRGGERIKPIGDAHTRRLRKLFQQASLPPWQRHACPLIYAGEELVAVADLWINERGEALFREATCHPKWQPGN